VLAGLSCWPVISGTATIRDHQRLSQSRNLLPAISTPPRLSLSTRDQAYAHGSLLVSEPSHWWVQTAHEHRDAEAIRFTHALTFTDQTQVQGY